MDNDVIAEAKGGNSRNNITYCCGELEIEG
jgi:hypothetical protein